jgi:thiol-disulfide isomerase/thioredoxin
MSVVMRWSLLVPVSLALLAACSDPGSDAVRPRTDGVVGSGSAGSSSKGPAGAASASDKPRKLCDRPLAKPGAKPSAQKLASVHAEGETALGDTLPIGGGKWTWINVWAGWCEPCLEEIPLLKQWEDKLKDKLRVAFVSFDDDPRLAVRFLASQPKDGVRRSHHLEDMDARKSWLESMGASASTLPLQVLVDPQGVVRCIASGSVKAADLPEIEALVSK